MFSAHIRIYLLIGISRIASLNNDVGGRKYQSICSGGVGWFVYCVSIRSRCAIAAGYIRIRLGNNSTKGIIYEIERNSHVAKSGKRKMR